MLPEYRGLANGYRLWGEYWLEQGWSCEEVNFALAELHARVYGGERDLVVFAELNHRHSRGRLLPGEGELDGEG